MKKLLIGLLALAGIGLAVNRAAAVVSDTDTQTVCALGNGVTTNYTIGFDFRDNDEVKVYNEDQTTTPYTRTLLVYGSGAGKYTITGGDPGTTVVMGTANPATSRCIIKRVNTFTQGVDYDESAAFPAEDHEEQMDKMTFLLQELDAAVDRAPALGVASTATVPTFPDPLASRLIGYNSGATDLTYYPASSDSTSANDILLFNGTNWTSTADTKYTYESTVGTAKFNANKLQGYDVSSTAPTEGYQLVYTSSAWRPVPYTANLPTLGAADTILQVDSSGVGLEYGLLANANVDPAAAIAYSKLNLATSIVNADVSASAAIVDTKLATISTAGKVSNSATTAASANTASAIVARDGSGNFSAGTVTANLTGNVTGNLTGDVTGNVTGNVTGTASGNIANTLTTTTGDIIYASGANTPARLGIGSTGKVLKSNGTIPTWGDAEGAGGINYIQQGGGNDKLEVDTTGWATYADAAGSTPVDGTAGSPTLTFTRTTSSPLRGTGSGLITKDAANRQGEGSSYAFSIDTADQGKVLSINFDYTIASGTYADGDQTAYIYDVTNTTVIQPAGYSILGVTAGLPHRHIATFQTASNSTSYRLIFHTASTSASAYTVKIDNVNVGPQQVQFGAGIGDWTSCTITGAWVSNTTYTCFRRRVGGNEEFDVKIATSGAPTSATLTLTLPVTIDTTRLTSSTQYGAVLGKAVCYDSGNAGNCGVLYNTTTTVVLTDTRNAPYEGAFGLVTQAAPFTFGAGDSVHAQFSVPVVGYSSSVQMSNDTDTRVVTARLSRNTAQSVNNTTATVLQWDAAEKDTHGAVSGLSSSSARWTAPVPGEYEACASVGYAGDVDGIREARLRKNGTTFKVLAFEGNNIAAQSTIKAGCTSATLVAGDYLDIEVYHSAGAAINVCGDGNTYCYFTVTRISGPSAIAASESVNARYNTNASQALANNTLTIIDYEDKVFDSHNAVTTGASWKFTAPVAGKYAINCKMLVNTGAGWAAAEPVEWNVYKNGSLWDAVVNYQQATHTTYVQNAISSLVSMVAGDYIDCRATQISGGATTVQASANFSSIDIYRVGN